MINKNTVSSAWEGFLTIFIFVMVILWCSVGRGGIDIPPNFLEPTPIAKIALKAWKSPHHTDVLLMMDYGIECRFIASVDNDGSLTIVLTPSRDLNTDSVYFTDIGLNGTVDNFFVQRMNNVLSRLDSEDALDIKEKAYWYSVYRQALLFGAKVVENSP